MNLGETRGSNTRVYTYCQILWRSVCACLCSHVCTHPCVQIPPSLAFFFAALMQKAWLCHFPVEVQLPHPSNTLLLLPLWGPQETHTISLSGAAPSRPLLAPDCQQRWTRENEPQQGREGIRWLEQEGDIFVLKERNEASLFTSQLNVVRSFGFFTPGFSSSESG